MKISNLQTARRRAVTLTELLVVLAIIGLLATLAVPTYLNHVEMAKVRVALTECRAYAEAELACAIQHGFFVPLQILDDVASIDDTDNDFDDLWNSNQEFPEILLIDPNIRPDVQQGFQFELDQYQQAGNFSKRVGDLYHGWNGPFINPARVYTGRDYVPNIPQALDDFERALDWPLDPWGNPYRLYSPLGVVGQDADFDTNSPGSYANALESPSFGDGELTTNGNYEFDRYAIVSYGPDGAEGVLGLSGNNAVEDEANDDVMRFFGRLPNETAYRVF